MNWQSLLILALVIAAAVLALRYGKKHGRTCACGFKKCDSCCAGCSSCQENNKPS